MLLSPSVRLRLTLFSGWQYEALLPPREEGAGPALGLVTPELATGLFEQVGGVQALVGLEQLGEGSAAVEGEVLAVGEQRRALSLDEGAVLGCAADGVERLAEVTHDMELVEDDARLLFTPSVAYSHFVWAIISTKEHVRAFVQREGLSESAMELHEELELLHLLSHFFDLMLYYAAVGYEQERNRMGGTQRRRKGD